VVRRWRSGQVDAAQPVGEVRGRECCSHIAGALAEVSPASDVQGHDPPGRRPAGPQRRRPRWSKSAGRRRTGTCGRRQRTTAPHQSSRSARRYRERCPGPTQREAEYSCWFRLARVIGRPGLWPTAWMRCWPPRPRSGFFPPCPRSARVVLVAAVSTIWRIVLVRRPAITSRTLRSASVSPSSGAGGAGGGVAAADTAASIRLAYARTRSAAWVAAWVSHAAACWLRCAAATAWAVRASAWNTATQPGALLNPLLVSAPPSLAPNPRPCVTPALTLGRCISTPPRKAHTSCILDASRCPFSGDAIFSCSRRTSSPAHAAAPKPPSRPGAARRPSRSDRCRTNPASD